MIHPLVTAAALLGTAMLAPVIHAQENKDTLAIPMDTHMLATQGAAPAPGTTFTTTRIFAYDHLSMKLTAGGKVTEGIATRKDTTVETFEGLGPGKIRRTLASTNSEGETTLNGQKSKPPRKLDALLETPVVLTRDGAKWTAALEKGDAFENQKHALTTLEQAFNRDPAFAAYGKAPRKPGDKWNASLDAFSPEIFGEFADGKNVEGTITLEFIAMKQQQDTPCAQLKAVFDLKGTPKSAPGGTFTYKGEGQVLRSLRDQVDLAWNYKATVSVTDKGNDAGHPAMQISGPVTISGTTTVKRR